MAALIMPCEECILAIESYRSDSIFDGICVHLNPAIRQEDLHPIPVPVDVGELLAEAGFGEDAATLMCQPLAKVGNKRSRLVLPDSEALIGGLASDLGLDLVDFREATLAFGGDFGTVFLVNIMQFAPCVGPAQSQAGTVQETPMSPAGM